MVKGLILSILDSGPLPDGISIAFLDLGLDRSSRQWLEMKGVLVRAMSSDAMGDLCDPSLGYQRAQTCRPFLPSLFPEASSFVWMDSDMWVQDHALFPILSTGTAQHPQQLFIAPECHFSYFYVNEYAEYRFQEMYSYYAPICGDAEASRLARLPTLNSGLFAMSAQNEIWPKWSEAIRQVFSAPKNTYDAKVLHMSDQITLNMLARCGERVTLIDPLYNYLCMWTPPRRGEDGVVRVALPPHLPVGIIHLAGGWKQYGERYLADGLFYQRGEYLSDSDLKTLFAKGRHIFDFRKHG
jgi:hypothetical protein